MYNGFLYLSICAYLTSTGFHFTCILYASQYMHVCALLVVEYRPTSWPLNVSKVHDEPLHMDITYIIVGGCAEC